MKRVPQIILSIVFSSQLICSYAQTYQVTVENEPFVFLEKAESATDEAWSVPEFQVSIGFDFPFFDISSNQFYSFDNSVGGLYMLNDDEEHAYALIPFYASMIDRGYSQDSALSPITYQTIGNVGQRIFTLELKEAGLFYGREDKNAIYLDHISFQVRLYEATGDIEFHIGPYDIQEDPAIIFEPFPGPIIGLLADAENSGGGYIGEIILLEGDPLNPIVRTDSIDAYLTWPIPENTVYRFSRRNTDVNEIASNAHQTFFFPNPSSGEIYLDEHMSTDVIYPIRVMNVYGSVIREWTTKDEISVYGLEAGSYYVVIVTNEKVVTEKLIVVDGE